MSSILACPFCGRKLRVSDELRGQMVRCPACNETFDSARQADPPPPANESSPAPSDLPLQLTIDESSSEPKPEAGGAPGLVGAVELKLSLDHEDDPSPRSPAESPAEPPEPPRRK